MKDISRILITGAAGFIGSQLAYRLWQGGYSLTLVDNFSYGKEDNLIFEDHIFTDEILRKSICDQKYMDDLFKEKKFDYVYHFAGITPLPDCQVNPPAAIEVNVRGTAVILEAARKFGVRNVIFSSTSAVYENNDIFPTKESDEVRPTLIYSASKYMAEQLCRSYADTYGMNVTVLRFANVFGPHLDCLRAQPPVAGYIIRELYYDRPVELHSDGTQRRDYIYVDDLLELAERVMGNTGFDIVNVSTGKTRSVNEMYAVIANLMGKSDVNPEYLPTDHYWYRYPDLYKGAYPINPGIMAHEVVKHTECDNHHALLSFGWAPKTSFEKGLKNTVDFTLKVLESHDKNT